MMRSNLKAVAIVFGVAALTAGALAQVGGGGQGRGGMRMMGMGGPGGGAMLAFRQDVQNDLKVSAEQKTKLDALREGMMGQFGGGRGPGGPPPGGGGGGQAQGGAIQVDRAQMEARMKKMQDDVNAILTPEQQARLKQIRVQLAGSRAALDPEVQKDLGLSEEQKAKLATLQKNMEAANMQLMQRMREQQIDMQDARDAFEKNEKIMDDEVAKVLTEDQKAKLKAMAGPEFKADQRAGGFGGGRGGGGGGRGG